MLTFLDVKGAATDASAIDKEIPEMLNSDDFNDVTRTKKF